MAGHSERSSWGSSCSAAGVPASTPPRSGFVSLLRVAVFMMWTLKILNVPQETAAISLAPVNWNNSNPMFKSSKNDHVIQVKPYDDLDFVCPYHPRFQNSDYDEEEDAEMEERNAYYTIYMVSKVEYDDCNIYSESQTVMMLNCSNPRHRKRFTILFEPFPSIPNVPEYQQGSTYYFISTSTGTRNGLGNLYQGACSHQNMKLTIRICCDHSSSKHTNAILPDMTSSHQRKNGHLHRQQLPEATNHRRSRINEHLEDRHGKELYGEHLVTAFPPLSSARGFSLTSRLRPTKEILEGNARINVQNTVAVISIQDAVQDSLVHNTGNRFDFLWGANLLYFLSLIIFAVRQAFDNVHLR